MESDWKHLLRTENSQKSLFKKLYYNNKGTVKVKEIFFILQFHDIKYTESFKFISFSFN